MTITVRISERDRLTVNVNYFSRDQRTVSTVQQYLNVAGSPCEDILIAVAVEVSHGDRRGRSTHRVLGARRKTPVPVAREDGNRAGSVAHNHVEVAVRVEIGNGRIASSALVGITAPLTLRPYSHSVPRNVPSPRPRSTDMIPGPEQCDNVQMTVPVDIDHFRTTDRYVFPTTIIGTLVNPPEPVICYD